MSAPLSLARGGCDRRHLVFIAFYGAISTAWVVLAGWALLEFARAEVRPPFWLFPVVVVLICCAATQAWLTRHTGATRFSARLWDARWILFRQLLLGAMLTYVVALVIGPRPQVAWLWLAMLAVWQTLMLLPLAASGHIADQWRRWTQARTGRRLTGLVYATALLVAVAEGTARIHHLATERRALAVVQSPAAKSPAATSDRLVPVRFDQLKAGRFRVALVGDEPDAANSLAARVQQSLPGAEIVALEFASPSGPRHVREARAAIEQSACDLILVVVSVCEDLAREPAAISPFDWRQLALARFFAAATADTHSLAAPARDYETHLSRMSGQLSACQTPLTATMRERWQHAFDALDRLAAGSRLAEVPLALVVVPGEFQFDAALRQTLLRRAGLAPEQCDVELPQRRLAGYADQRRLPVVDLLPHLRLCDESVFQRNDTALNDHGNRAAAAAIGGWLASRYGDQLVAQLSKAP